MHSIYLNSIDLFLVDWQGLMPLALIAIWAHVVMCHSGKFIKPSAGYFRTFQ